MWDRLGHYPEGVEDAAEGPKKVTDIPAGNERGGWGHYWCDGAVDEASLLPCAAAVSLIQVGGAEPGEYKAHSIRSKAQEE